MSILIFEDALVDQLAPITTARAACSISVGSYTLLDLMRLIDHDLVAYVRPHLRTLFSLDQSDVRQVGDPHLEHVAPPTLAINARLIPSIATLNAILQLLTDDQEQSGIVWDGDQVAAVVRPNWKWESLATNTASGIESILLSARQLPSLQSSLKVVNYPHDVIAANMRVMNENLNHRIASGRYQQTKDGVFLGSGARLGEYVLTETQSGPVVIDSDAQVGPYTLLRGPLYIGSKTRILEHAAIKDAVSLGHTTKIGGEVEASIVEPYSNKQHHGFLGHSYLGSWINLGAGTCNSDLKNTYGAVNMEYPAGKATTGMQFLGCVMGDYSKTAINTGIFTGKVIGVCSMMYGFVTSNVPSFVNYARLFGQMTTLPPEVMTATQQRMFARRKVEQRPSDMQLIFDMYRLTQHERDRFGDALAF
jgi:UDP-N-acetylglucosamine diphosphorylase / glucose-1-phosphate thymidylyltransferase / UDP-N-acetylgalactosamine diphosphorylase / glucosamine-1-phosphate N-acetyltransferase / galactosamine-1-phosphate N-acetyltransferase